MLHTGIDWSYMIRILPKLINVVPFTLFVVLLAGIGGLLLGIPVTLVRVGKYRVLYPAVAAYVSFTRSTPGLIQLFVIYYGLPLFLRSISLDISQMSRTAFAVLTLILHNGAYVSEILRPAYLAVDRGQHDAADSIGLTERRKLQRIIIPQLLPIALPNLGNLLIDLIKDTSLLFTIGVVDLMGRAKTLIAGDYGIGQLEVYIAVAVLYWTITFMAEKGMARLEKIRHKRKA